MAARRAAIWKAAQDLARARGGRVPESAAGDLLEEVANLVEVPTPVDGGFDPDFLQLPKEARARTRGHGGHGPPRPLLVSRVCCVLRKSPSSAARGAVGEWRRLPLSEFLSQSHHPTPRPASARPPAARCS